jgi:hypothetical protein
MKTTDEIRLRETHTKQSRQDITYLKVADITSRSSATAWTPHNLNIGWIFLIRYYRSEVSSRSWIRDMCSDLFNCGSRCVGVVRVLLETGLVSIEEGEEEGGIRGLAKRRIYEQEAERRDRERGGGEWD